MFTQASQDPTMRARIVAVHALPGVRAGSGLLRLGDRLLAVQDDAWCVVWITLPGLELEAQPLKGDGAPLPRKHKPDFEAAVCAPGGSIHLLGSGSLGNRCTLVRIDPARSAVQLVERPDIYDCVSNTLRLAGRPNIEGATVAGDRLRLFHRGVGAARSAWVDLPLAVLDGAAPAALAWREFDLGQLDNVTSHFTDAATIGPGHTMFLATAEDIDNAIDDGPVAGSAIGHIHESPGEPGAPPVATWTRLLEADGRPSIRKAEGLAVDDDGRRAWILTDPDDAAGMAQLCRVVMERAQCR